MSKLSEILNSEKQFISAEIQTEISAIKANQATAKEKLLSLGTDLEAEELKNLGKPLSKKIKQMKAERSDLSDSIATMGIALEKLEKIHDDALNHEIPAEIKQVREEISRLVAQKEALMPDALAVLGKAVGLYFQLRGEHRIEINPKIGPDIFLSRAEQQPFFDALQDALEGKTIIPEEMNRQQARLQELLAESRRRGI